MSEASYQRWLQRWTERRNLEIDANQRAVELLGETLDDLQVNLLLLQADCDAEVFIPVVGRFANYHISSHTTLCFGMAPSMVICLHPGSYRDQRDLYPVWDYMAMHKLMLDAEEETFLWHANQQLPSTQISQRVKAEMEKLALWLEVMQTMDDLDPELSKLARYYAKGLHRTSYEPHPLAGTLIPTTERPLSWEDRTAVVSVLRGYS